MYFLDESQTDVSWYSFSGTLLRIEYDILKEIVTNFDK